jgi:hypothetical protein
MVEIPSDVWRDVCGFFEQIISPCKECVWGNPVKCWRSECAAFKFRPLARDVLSVTTRHAALTPAHIRVENEILEALKGFDRPVHPADLKLWTTNSRAVKSKAISRLVRYGLITELREGKYSRCISLANKGNN